MRARRPEKGRPRRLTDQQLRFALELARGGDREDAGERAGYARTRQLLYKLTRKPNIRTAKAICERMPADDRDALAAALDGFKVGEAATAAA
jgi:hypothetical protein